MVFVLSFFCNSCVRGFHGGDGAFRLVSTSAYLIIQIKYAYFDFINLYNVKNKIFEFLKKNYDAYIWIMEMKS